MKNNKYLYFLLYSNYQILNCQVMSIQVVQLKKGMYQIIEEIGHGASSKVFKISKFLDSSEIIGLKTNQSIYSKPCLDGKAGAKLQANPDLVRIDSLISAQQEGIHESDPLLHKDSSFLIDHGRENRKPSFSYKDDNKPQTQEEEDEFYALKTITLTSDQPESAIKEKNFLAQLSILKELDHPGIIKVIDDVVLLKNDKKELHAVMEWCSGGTLHKLIDTIHGGSFNSAEKEEIFKYYFSQITEILRYLDMKGVSHRDIKAQNFVLDDKYHLKLIDFGSFERITGFQEVNSLQSSQKCDRNYIGTIHYISPEMIDRTHKSFPREYYSKVDIWSAGVLVYFMMIGRYPFGGRNTFKMIGNIKIKDPHLDKFSEPLREILSLMLKKNPDQRISINELVKFSYFEGVNFSEIFQTEPPYARLINKQPSQQLYRCRLTIKDDNRIKQRIVSLIKKKVRCQKAIKGTPIMQKNCSLSFLDIKSNCSENSQYQTEKKIESQTSLDEKLIVKKYLGFAKIGSKAYPRLAQVQPSTRMSVSGLICKINWPEKEEGNTSNQSNQVQLKFDDFQKLQLFIKAFQLLQEQSHSL